MSSVRRISWGASIGAIIPCLLAGLVAGGFLRSSRADGISSPAPKRAERLSDRPTADAAPTAPTSTAAESPDPQKVGAAREAPKAFRARLVDFAEAARKARAILADEKDRKNLDRRLRELRSTLGDLRDLHDAALADPAAYLAFLKDPENEEVLGVLLGLLSPLPDPVSFHIMTSLEKIPRPILDGITDLLAAGTPGQKLAILRCFEDQAMFLLQTTAAREDLTKRCLPLLSATEDPRVRAQALWILHACGAPLDPHLDLVRELWQKSSDPRLRADCLRALGRMKSPEAEDLFVDRVRAAVREASATADPTVVRAGMEQLRERAATTPIDAAGRYAELWSLGIREIRRPDLYAEWMDALTALPVKQLVPLFEEAATYAPTPELQAAARRVLELVRSGETRLEKLRPPIWGAK